jgi:hypothetical protein
MDIHFIYKIIIIRNHIKILQIYGLNWGNKISMYTVKIFVVLDQHNAFIIKGHM